MSATNTINPKPCIYNCNTRIYWNNKENAYFEVFSQKRHICPNRTNNNNNKSNVAQTTTTATKPNYLRLGHNSIKKFYDANNSRMFSVIMFLACI